MISRKELIGDLKDAIREMDSRNTGVSGDLDSSASFVTTNPTALNKPISHSWPPSSPLQGLSIRSDDLSALILTNR